MIKISIYRGVSSPDGFGRLKCVCGQVKLPKCLFGCPNGQATPWKANFEKYSRYSLKINSYQYNTAWAILRSIRHMFLLAACSSQSHSTYSGLMSHHQINNKCNRVKGQYWRWLIYALLNFLWPNNVLHDFRRNHHCS